MQLAPTVAILGQHAPLLERARAIVQAAGFAALGTSDEHELVGWLDRAELRGIVIGGGVESPVRARVHAIAAQRRPDVRVFDVFGGPAAMADALRELAAVEAK